jgi:hypothetical protein
MNYSELRLVWSGSAWNVETSGPAHCLQPGAEFLIRLPVAAEADQFAPLTVLSDVTSASPTGIGLELFPAGTWLYLPLNPVQNEDKLWALWVAHRDSQHPALSKSPDRPLVPFLLEDDLRFAHAGSRSLAPCRCRIGERAFDSLNQAASYALLKWTANEAGAINVFDGVRFIHNKALVRLRDQRSHILDGDQLPENADTDEGTPTLFPEMEG